MGARDKIAYIRGLLDAGNVLDGLPLTLCRSVVEALEALAAENEELKTRLSEQQKAIDDLNFVCEELDADLADVESCLELGDGELDGDSLKDDEYESDYFETECPSCGLHFFCHSSLLTAQGEAECPNCSCRFTPELKSENAGDESER